MRAWRSVPQAEKSHYSSHVRQYGLGKLCFVMLCVSLIDDCPVGFLSCSVNLNFILCQGSATYCYELTS